MNTFDYWRPHKLEEHGIQQILAARDLLERHHARLSSSNRDRAQSLLVFAEDLRSLLRGKRLLARIQLGRRYNRKAVEVLQIIQRMVDPQLELDPLHRPTHS